MHNIYIMGDLRKTGYLSQLSQNALGLALNIQTIALAVHNVKYIQRQLICTTWQGIDGSLAGHTAYNVTHFSDANLARMCISIFPHHMFNTDRHLRHKYTILWW